MNENVQNVKKIEIKKKKNKIKLFVNCAFRLLAGN